MTAAVGMTVGLGGFGIAALSVVLDWFILAIIGRITQYLDLADEMQNPNARKGDASNPPKKKAADPNKEE